jgi:hypothetical protein
MAETYPGDVTEWTHRHLRQLADINVTGGAERRRDMPPRDVLSQYRTLEAVHPHCPNCWNSLQQPQAADGLKHPPYLNRGIAFTVTCSCGTTATGVFYR